MICSWWLRHVAVTCGLALLASAGLVGCHASAPAVQKTPVTGPEEKVLNILNWSDYIAPDTLEKFEKETGIKVNYDLFDSNEVLETKLLTGRTGYDIVVPSDYFLERQLKVGVYLPLDLNKLPNYVNLDPAVMRALEGHDPGNRYGVPYLSVLTGIGYNVDMVKKALGDIPLDSWAVIFDPKNAAKLQDCGISMLDQQAEVLFSAKLWLGIKNDAEGLEGLAAAEAMLQKVRPYVRYFHSSQYINDLANGETCIALGWSGDVLQARDRANEAGKGVRIDFVDPKEGVLRTFDMLAIPADAPHPDNAHKFINFVLRADIAADISRFRKYPSANLAALKLLEPQFLTDPIMYPAADALARMQTHPAESLAYARYANRAWTRIRTQH